MGIMTLILVDLIGFTNPAINGDLERNQIIKSHEAS